MKDELFNELLESVREGGAILRGEKAPARVFNVEKLPDAGKTVEMDETSNNEHRFPVN